MLLTWKIHANLLQKTIDFQVENREKSMKQCVEKSMFFPHRFFIDLEFILGGFGAPNGGQDGAKMGKLGVQKAN